jgi:signal transduction histidine kinase
MSNPRHSSITLLRRMVVANQNRPLPELIHRSLQCLVDSLEVRAAFLGRTEDGYLEVVDAVSASPPEIKKGTRFPLTDTIAGEDAAVVINIRDASKNDSYTELPMRQEWGIASYLGVPLHSQGNALFGTLAVVGKGPRLFTEQDADLLLIVAGLLGPRLEGVGESRVGAGNRAQAPVSAIRLASQEVKEPLAILRGYADMLRNNEVPAGDLPLVSRRLAMQSETVIRVVDQLMLMSRLPLQLAFTVRVSLGAVVQATSARVRDRMRDANMELRVQLDAEGDVWGDAALLEAALDEMLHNVFKHAQTATVVQLRLRWSAPDRFQLIVKDDGPGISAERLAELFAPLPSSEQQPGRGQGLGLYLLRRVAEAHGGSAWANSLEGKGTTFYMELPAASPDGEAVRATASIGKTSA